MCAAFNMVARTIVFCEGVVKMYQVKKIFDSLSYRKYLDDWEKTISPQINSGKGIMIVAHGNSLRALVKHLDRVSDKDIIGINIPTGVPLIYELDRDLIPIKNYYLGDQEKILEKIKSVEKQGESKK